MRGSRSSPRFRGWGADRRGGAAASRSLVEEVALRPSRDPPGGCAPVAGGTSLVEEVAQRPSRDPWRVCAPCGWWVVATERASRGRTGRGVAAASRLSGHTSSVEEVAQRPSRDPWRVCASCGRWVVATDRHRRGGRGAGVWLLPGCRAIRRWSRRPRGHLVGRGGRAATVTRPHGGCAPVAGGGWWRPIDHRRGGRGGGCGCFPACGPYVVGRGGRAATVTRPRNLLWKPPRRVDPGEHLF